MIYLDKKEGIIDLYKIVYVNIDNSYKVNKLNDMFKTYITEYIDKALVLNILINKDVMTYITIMKELLHDIVHIGISNKDDMISYLKNANIEKDVLRTILKALASVYGSLIAVYENSVDDLIAYVESSIIIAVSMNNLTDPVQKKNMFNLTTINNDLFENIERLDGSMSKYKSSAVKSFMFSSNGEHDIEKPIESAKMTNNFIIKTGIPIVDDIYGGLKPSTLTMGFSVTNGGKSVFSTNLLVSAWRNNYKTEEIMRKCQGREPVIVLFTHENTMEEIFHNMLTILLGDDYRQRVPKEYSSKSIIDILKASGEFDDLDERFSLYVLDIGEGLMSIQGMRTHLNKLRKSGYEPMLIIDDYIGLLKHTGGESKTPLGDLSQGLKNITKEFSVPVFTTAQMNFTQVHLIRDYDRDDKIACFSTHCIGKDKTILQPVDIGLFIYRTTVHGIDHMSVLINKIRNGASIYKEGKQRMAFMPYEIGYMYKTGSRSYSDVDEMILDVKRTKDKERMNVADSAPSIDILANLKKSSNVSISNEEKKEENIIEIMEALPKYPTLEETEDIDDLIYVLEKGESITQEMVEYIEKLDPNDSRTHYIWENFAPWRKYNVR